MVHKLQIVLERQVAIFAVEPCAFSPLACRRARGHKRGFSNIGSDVEALGAGFGFLCVGRRARSGDVFFAGEFGFVAGFSFFFDFGFSGGGFGGVFFAVVGFAEGGVGGCGVIGVFLWRVCHSGKVDRNEWGMFEVRCGVVLFAVEINRHCPMDLDIEFEEPRRTEDDPVMLVSLSRSSQPQYYIFGSEVFLKEQKIILMAAKIC